MFIAFIILNLYFYSWGSIHSNYHKRYIDVNIPLKNNSDITIYSPLKYFIPNQKSCIFKYLYWYHTLHHLNKGDGKCNYNIICPLFDFIFGTYKSNVNNVNYFSNNDSQNLRENWLKAHPEFDIRIADNIEYRDKDSNQWNPIPCI